MNYSKKELGDAIIMADRLIRGAHVYYVEYVADSETVVTHYEPTGIVVRLEAVLAVLGDPERECIAVNGDMLSYTGDPATGWNRLRAITTIGVAALKVA